MLAEPRASANTPQQKQSAARERINQTTAEIEAGRAGYDAARQQADAAASEEAGLSSLLATGQERSSDLAARLARAEAELARSKERLGRAREVLAEQLVAIYMSGGTPDSLELAFGAGNFDELVTGTAYLSAIQDSSDRLVQRVADLRRQLDGQVAGLAEARQAVEQHNAALASARDQIASVRAEAEASAAAFAAANIERQEQVDSLKQNIAGWQKQIERQQQVTAEEAEEEVEQHLGGPYSIPTYIVMCESGGDYSAFNPSSGAAGAYQIIPSTWEAYGGEGPSAHLASKAEQDRVAALIWADVGASAWVCA